MRETISLGGVLLPGGLLWQDEYSAPVSETAEALCGGARYIEETAIVSGRPVTLSTGNDIILTRAQLDALRDTMAVGAQLALILTDDEEYTVRWRYQDDPLEVTPAGYYRNPPPPDQPYFATIRLEIV